VVHGVPFCCGDDAAAGGPAVLKYITAEKCHFNKEKLQDDDGTMTTL
jgi:hypothetical protein